MAEAVASAEHPSNVADDARPGFLVVEDDDLVARWLVRAFSKFRPVQRAASVAEGRTRLADPTLKLLALCTDINLPDGLGLDVLRTAKELHPRISALVLTANTQPKIVNNSFLLGASFLTKPTTEESLETFARRALACEGVEDTRVLHVVEAVATEWSLSDREVELLGLAVADRPRDELADALGVTENTTKTQVKNLLRKSNTKNLDHLVRVILKRALQG